MLNSRSHKYLLFALLYFAQGSVLGYFSSLNALYLRSFNLSMTQIGIFTAIALIPMVLKIFWGMLSDKVNLFGWGHRKPYIVIGLLMQAGGQFIFPYIDPGHSFGLLIAVAFFSLLGMALFDTCTDGLALDITPPGEMGKIQGIMVGGRASGIVIISATVGFLSQFTNWHAVFMALVIMTLVPLPWVLFMKEPSRPHALTFNIKAFRSLGNRAVIGIGLFGVISTMITGGANQLINPFLQETFGISYLAAGLFASVVGIGVILGGLMGGRLSDRFGNQKAILGALIVALVAVSLLAAITGSAMTWALMLLFGLSYGYYQTVYFATSMSVTDPRIAASMYALLMAMSNIGSGIGLSTGGRISDAIGFRSTFLFFAALNLLVLPLLLLIFRKKKVPG